MGNNSGSPAPIGTQAGYNVGGLGTPAHYRTDCQSGSTLCDGIYNLNNAYPPDGSMDRPGLLDFDGHAGSLAVTRRLAGADLVAAYAQRRQGNYFAGEHGPTPTLDLSDRIDRGFYTEIRPEVDGASRVRGGEEVVNTHFESESVLLKTRLYPSDEHTLDLSYLRYDSEYGELMPSELLWLGRIKQTRASEVTANTYTARYQWQPFDNDWLDLDSHFWHTDTESRNNSYSDEMLELLNGRPGTEIYQRWGGDVSNTTSITSLGDLQFRYGLAWQREDVEPKRYEQGNGFGLRDGEREETSGFLAMKWTFVPTLTLDAGIRYTRYDSGDRRPTEVNDPNSDFCVDGNGDGECDPLYNDFSGSGSAPWPACCGSPARPAVLRQVLRGLAHAEPVRDHHRLFRGGGARPAHQARARQEQGSGHEHPQGRPVRRRRRAAIQAGVLREPHRGLHHPHHPQHLGQHQHRPERGAVPHPEPGKRGVPWPGAVPGIRSGLGLHRARRHPLQRHRAVP
ncbi:TonB-dependent receptor [Alcanivorax sp. IO_7]|nr:TonB-dependent receptor [Alcanivorax sp. IO_7]